MVRRLPQLVSTLCRRLLLRTVHSAPSWWEATAGVVGEVLIWGGSYEILLDGIEEFAHRFKKGYGGSGEKVTIVITDKAAHEEMVVERMLGYKQKSESARAVEDWVKAKL